MKIEPSFIGAFQVGHRELRVCADTEVIVRFVDSRFDYLRYVDDDNGCIACVWLTPPAYAGLVEFGIPETTLRDTITESEHENWLEYQTLCISEYEADFDE